MYRNNTTSHMYVINHDLSTLDCHQKGNFSLYLELLDAVAWPRPKRHSSDLE